MTDKIDTSSEAVNLMASQLNVAGLDEYEAKLTSDAAVVLRALSARTAELEAAIKRQAGAAKTLRMHTLAEVQHIKENERKQYTAILTLDSEREANAILTKENDALSARVAELEERYLAVVGDKINLRGEVATLKEKLAKADAWQEAVFDAHPNIDLDIETKEHDT